jgi:hypothetical protein
MMAAPFFSIEVGRVELLDAQFTQWWIENQFLYFIIQPQRDSRHISNLARGSAKRHNNVVRREKNWC